VVVHLRLGVRLRPVLEQAGGNVQLVLLGSNVERGVAVLGRGVRRRALVLNRIVTFRFSSSFTSFLLAFLRCRKICFTSETRYFSIFFSIFFRYFFRYFFMLIESENEMICT
jgi:hypothetical protein